MGEREAKSDKAERDAQTMGAPAGTAVGPIALTGADPAMYAKQLRANPAARDQLLTRLHQTFGNAFVQQVVDQLRPQRAVPAAGKGGGQPLPAEARASMERAFGADLSAVRVHEDAAAEGAGAEAYAHGTDIHFAPGRFDPSSTRGLELLGHEVAHVVQQAEGRGAAEDAGLEHEADDAGARAARGEPTTTSSSSLGTAAPVIQRKATVTAVASARKPKLDVLGDGTPAHRGLAIDALEAYTTKQVDWFTDPSFTAAERDATWKVVNLFHFGPHVSSALAKLHTGEVAALPDRATLMAYVNGFNSAADAIQLSTPAATIADALAIGKAMQDLSAFVPGAARRHVIPEAGLEYLMKKAKIPELQAYFTQFQPTLEKPDEWAPIQILLDEGIKLQAPLAGWISELHIFTPAARATLRKNVGDKSKTKPVMLVVMSALDWNTAFLQKDQLDKNLADGHNLGLVVQGRTMAAVTAQVARVAADYGKGGKLGQVVLAGHGSDTSMEMASDSKASWWDAENNRVQYDGQADLNSKADPKKNGTEALIDTILTNLDPATANLVFAGCLINSHDIDPTKSKLTGKPADVEKQLRANIKAHPNLADYVKSRMVATGHNAAMSAANASTIFATFNLDGTGKAQLKDVTDPDIGGSKLGYLRTGIEPEGVLRAALEVCADPAQGVAAATAEIRTRVTALAGSTDHWQSCIRAGFQLALPAAPGTVDVGKLADVVHRIETWSELDRATPAQRLADSVHKDEAKPVFDALLADTMGDDVDANIHQAWMKHDPAHAAQMMAKLETSGMTVEDFKLQLARGIVTPHLKTMLPIGGAPTPGQMLLALTLADDESAPVPAEVHDFLRAAAGGAAARSFPLGLGVDAIAPNAAPRILQRIGLSDKAPPPATGAIDGNVDLDGDGKNETLVTSDARKAEVEVDNLMVRATATSEAKDLGKLAKGAVIRVAGTTRNGTWSMIEFNGKAAFVKTQYLKVAP